MTEDPIICYCFGTTRDEVREVMSRPGSTIDDLFRETRVATKCTACSLDLDVLLDDLVVPKTKAGATQKEKRSDSGLAHIRTERTDSGFFVNDHEISTMIRLANYAPMFEDEFGPARHRWHLWVFGEDGRVAGRRDGFIERDQEQTIEVGPLAGAVGRGWFLLTQYPQADGFYGSLRPQCALQGPDWVTCYHTQLHADATRSGRRSSAPARVINRHTNTLVSVINGANCGTGVRATVHKANGAGESAYEFELDARGSCMLDLDEAFTWDATDGAVTISFESDEPTRKNLIIREPDGRWNVDHFPNMQ